MKSDSLTTKANAPVAPSLRDHEATAPAKVEWLDLVARQVSSLRFGTVQIVVHEGRVTQVESTEKIRLSSD